MDIASWAVGRHAQNAFVVFSALLFSLLFCFHCSSVFFVLLPQYNQNIHQKVLQHRISVSAVTPLTATSVVTGYPKVADFIATDKELVAFDKSCTRGLTGQQHAFCCNCKARCCLCKQH